MNEDAPQSLSEAWDLFNSRRFLHGHRESQRDSFEVVLKNLFDAPEAAARSRALSVSTFTKED